MPCFELFDDQDADYRSEVLGSGVRIAVEAASPFGWARYVGDEPRLAGRDACESVCGWVTHESHRDASGRITA